MAETDPFHDMIHRVRRGEPDGAEELWRRFEPTLRREVRLRLRDPRLRRRFDETDVCQSVMASFFVRAAAGQFDLDSIRLSECLVGRQNHHEMTKCENAKPSGLV